MTLDATTPPVHAAAPDTVRYDMYADIHKAMRALMCDTLARLGSLDARDALEGAAVLGQVRELLDMCRAHLEHENAFVHAAMEARCPGSSAGTRGDHADHEEAIRRLEETLEEAAGTGREAVLGRLYRDLAVFVGENLVHMAEEERGNNAVLWRHYSDAELLAVEQALVASTGPAEQRLVLSWMLPALNPGERAAKLAGIRAGAPEPVYRQVLDVARTRLSGAGWNRLQADLQAL
jgi:hypothetical protein